VDWERGEMSGIPLWGWLHFIIQPAILVEQASGQSILGRIEKFFESAPLIRYAERAGLSGHERPLCLAYLHYSIRVLRPSEGLAQLEALADAALKQWFSAKPFPGPAS